jgi:hypothetical protein
MPLGISSNPIAVTTGLKVSEPSIWVTSQVFFARSGMVHHGARDVS